MSSYNPNKVLFLKLIIRKKINFYIMKFLNYKINFCSITFSILFIKEKLLFNNTNFLFLISILNLKQKFSEIHKPYT